MLHCKSVTQLTRQTPTKPSQVKSYTVSLTKIRQTQTSSLKNATEVHKNSMHNKQVYLCSTVVLQT